VIPPGFIRALDWIYGTRRKWSRLPKGSTLRRNYLAVAWRIAELGSVAQSPLVRQR
jgi:hypothetical protein